MRMRSERARRCVESGGLTSTSIKSLMANARAAGRGDPRRVVAGVSFLRRRVDEGEVHGEPIERRRRSTDRVEVSRFDLGETSSDFSGSQDERSNPLTGFGYEV